MDARSPWAAPNPSKEWAEVFFLGYAVVWVTALLGIVVPFQFYESWDEWGYLLCGVFTAAPLVLYPLLFPGACDRGKPLLSRYWVKANIWLAIFGFVGNYFWTHYFFKLLGAAYTMPSHRLNDIPLVMFLLTHAYFCMYHALSNKLIRRVKAATARWSPPSSRAAVGLAIFALAYVTAFMETFTISQYPYYTHEDKGRMYTIGSLFYAIYFWVSFPAFFRMDEDVKVPRFSAGQAAWDALAASMLVTILLDLWRICLGPIGTYGSSGADTSLPFMAG